MIEGGIPVRPEDDILHGLAKNWGMVPTTTFIITSMLKSLSWVRRIRQLLRNKIGLGDHRTYAARPQESGKRSNDGDKINDEIAHSGSLPERLKPQ
jgi:hypothetical protein